VNRTSSTLAAAVAALFTLAACGAGNDSAANPPPTTSSVTAEAITTTTVAASTTSAAQRPYVATTVLVTGTQGPLTYHVVVPQLAGGDPAVAKAFNDAVRASLQDRIDGGAGNPHGTTAQATLTDARSTITHIGSRVASGLLQTALDTGGAHPLVEDGTVVIDLDNGNPVLLGDLFPDEQAGLQRLSEQVGPLIAAQQPDLQVLPAGTAPVEKNFTSWQATPDGMQIIFGDYQIGPRGVVSVTVPWSALSDLADPGVLAVVSS
jgi:hypothetical protein